MVKYLPRTIINFPIFNKELLTYSINFLGKPIIIRKNKCLNVILSPKELGLLGFICEKCCSPGAFSLVEEIYANFWPRSSKPAERLTHLLVQLRHKLKIPSHLLFITWAYGEKRIVNRGIYFITDYQDFRSLIVQAKVLQRAGEWGFARKEYLQAFKLFRGEPFKKNFDNWSVDMRFKILSQFETEAINFAKSCLEHGNKTDARKILQKVLKIIPDSQEAIDLVKRLNG